MPSLIWVQTEFWHRLLPLIPLPAISLSNRKRLPGPSVYCVTCRELALSSGVIVRRRWGQEKEKRLHLTSQEDELHRPHWWLMIYTTGWVVYNVISRAVRLSHICVAPRRVCAMRQRTYVTSVHDAAQGLWGVGLRKSQAEVTERIRDTLHRPDDTYIKGRRGQSQMSNKQNTVCVWILMDRIFPLFVSFFFLSFFLRSQVRRGSGNNKCSGVQILYCFWPFWRQKVQRWWSRFMSSCRCSMSGNKGCCSCVRG